MTISVSIKTARAVFSINAFPVLNNDSAWNGLKENPCWPRGLASEDPGFALLTEDEFYKAGQHPELAQYTAR